jgi:flavin reductase (DIM6/NTAB) family NADH-FMN oxidoreductase RutF
VNGSVVSSRLEPMALRAAFGLFPSGVVAVCAEVDGRRVGMAASSFVAVSLAPPLVSICVQKTSRTWTRLRRAARIGISVLHASAANAVRALSAKEGDRFAGVSTSAAEGGALRIDGSCLWLGAALHEVVDAGDHEIVLLRVHEVEVRDGVEPIVFHRSGLRSMAREA